LRCCLLPPHWPAGLFFAVRPIPADYIRDLRPAKWGSGVFSAATRHGKAMGQRRKMQYHFCGQSDRTFREAICARHIKIWTFKA
jgi:hypothetical protein